MQTNDDSAGIDQAAAMLAAAQRVLVITGAGMSADSGLPTYRGVGGLYDRELTADGISIEQALSGDMFKRDPAVSWKYIAEIERACRGALPNDGHRALAAMAPRFERFCVLTQNVDGFHQSAGSRDVIEMHGAIHRLKCTRCHWHATVENYTRLDTLPPRCPDCSSVVRPDVVLFGEMLPDRALLQYEQALGEGFDLVMVVGTSAVFPYIAAPVQRAAMQRRATMEINPQRTDISEYCDVCLQTSAADALVALGGAMQAKV